MIGARSPAWYSHTTGTLAETGITQITESLTNSDLLLLNPILLPASPLQGPHLSRPRNTLLPHSLGFGVAHPHDPQFRLPSNNCQTRKFFPNEPPRTFPSYFIWEAYLKKAYWDSYTREAEESFARNFPPAARPGEPLFLQNPKHLGKTPHPRSSNS